MNKILKYEIIDNQKEDWVIFVHGIAGSTKTWKQQIDDFSKKYNLLLLDLPGHGNNAENTLNAVYNEPAAVSFTAEDRKYYSEQEMNLIEAVRKREMDLIQKGYVITNLDLDEDTIQMLEEYMSHTGKTFEESINEILAEAVKNPDLVQKVIEENGLKK